MIILGDGLWGTLQSAALGNVNLTVDDTTTKHRKERSDQRDTARPPGATGDIGASER